MVVASGSGENRHAYWLLVQAVDLGRIERVNGQLACALGADQRAGDAARILRPPGALNTKHSPATPVRLLRVQSRRIALAHLERDLPRDVSLVRAAPPALRPRAAPLDPLLSIAPAVYVERLTGQRVGRARKVHCPFHEDRTPSLHVYDEPDRGWFCFGCRRGGSIYDLAALLWERGTRGEEFIELRRELEETMP